MQEPYLEPLLRWMRLRRVMHHIPNDSILLDVGCGRAAAFLKAISPYIRQGIGVDFKVENTRFNNIETTQLRLENYLPFEDSSFNVVTMLAVLEHIDDDQQILKEIHRVLVPGGKLIVTVPSIWAKPVLEFLAYNLKIVSEDEVRDHKRYYTCQKLEQTFTQVPGFEEFHHNYFQLGMNNFCTVVKSSQSSQARF